MNLFLLYDKITKNIMEDGKMKLQETVNGYLEYCKYRKELDEKTLKAYRIDLNQYFESFTCDEPAKIEIEQYITELHKKYKQKTIKRKLASIKAFYSYLEEEELIRENPMNRIRAKFKEKMVLPRIVPRNEIEQLLNHIYQARKDASWKKRFWLRDLAVIEMCFATGARIYEISNIRRENVDLLSGTICIMGKGGKERYIQIGAEEVLELLRTYYQENKDAIAASGYFFVNQNGGRFSEQSMRAMLKKYTKQAGIERNITPHMFRHSFATYLIEEGVDISYVQELLGHSSIKTTQIYIHIAAQRKAQVLRELHPRRHMNIQYTI